MSYICARPDQKRLVSYTCVLACFELAIHIRRERDRTPTVNPNGSFLENATPKSGNRATPANPSGMQTKALFTQACRLRYNKLTKAKLYQLLEYLSGHHKPLSNQI